MTINDSYYRARAEIAKAMAHPIRIQMMDLLTEKGDLCVNELTELLNVSQSSVSKHLKLLKQSGLVDVRREGLQAFYHIRTPCVSRFFSCLDQILEEDLRERQKRLKINPEGGEDDE